MKLIDKDKVVAEIEKTYKFHEKRGNKHDSSICDVLYGLSHRIDTIETKEVDLEKEFYDFLDTLIGKDNGHLSEDELFRIAEYFYELGLKANK